MGVLAVALAAGVSLGFAGNAATPARAASGNVPGEAQGLGQLSGMLSPSKFTLKSAINVNLSNETVRLPLYPGTAYAGHAAC